MAEFIGRMRHLSRLKEEAVKQKASLTVIRGRRRIGKSRLIEEFSKTFKKALFFSGLAPDKDIDAQDQREEFIRQLREQSIPSNSRSDWGDLFTDLAQFCKKGRVLIVLDEITWMAHEDKTFLPKLKNVWDGQFKKNDQLMLILSGSDSAWITKNILSKTGFFGRVSLRMHLEELSLIHCSEFWGAQKNAVSAYEKLKLIAVTGGVPRYLEEINPKLTAEENIYRLCYRKEGILFNEFDDIFHDLFQSRANYYKDIIQMVANGSKTLDDIASNLKRTKGGDLTRNMNKLCEDGFLTRYHSWNLETKKTSRTSRYYLTDNYLRFFVKYIQPYRHQIEIDEMAALPAAWESIVGIQFENLVVKNRKQLHRLLNIPSHEIVMSNPYLQTKTKMKPGCQIDYLVQTKYNTLYLCEIKFSKGLVDTDVVEEVKKKVSTFDMPHGFSVRPVLIHVNGVTEGVIQKDYFAHIIDFSTFL